tara:strand:+ start:61 stop:561 length:501 start_codon:yes stop_codon:yes gene_type:complete
MIQNTFCPVPKEQRPLEEYKFLTNSWFFKLATKSKSLFYRDLLFCWAVFFPLCLLINNGSIELHNNFKLLLTTSVLCGFTLPIIVLIRLWLSWRYIYKRLRSEKVEYEESGWYDGQTWEKPTQWRAKEFLIANHDIQPIIKKVETALITTLIAIIISTLILISNHL